jgi:hypothetical protein
MKTAARGVAAGLSGAAAVVALDSVLARIPALNGSPFARGALRLAGGFAAATMAGRAAERVGSASGRAVARAAADGLLAGPVLVTALDVGVAMIGQRRTEPPPAQTVAQLGAPWAPSPPWVVGVPEGSAAPGRGSP